MYRYAVVKHQVIEFYFSIEFTLTNISNCHKINFTAASITKYPVLGVDFKVKLCWVCIILEVYL